MKVALIGYGKMSRAIGSQAKEMNVEIVSISTKSDPLTKEKLEMADVAIDCSSPDAVLEHLDLALLTQTPIVIGTTGWDDKLEEAKRAVLEKKGALLFSPNFSIAVLLFIELLKRAKELFSLVDDFDLAGLELHHKNKRDAPSGTAKAIASLFDDQFLFSSVRVGAQPGTHSVIADSETDTITLTHLAKNRNGFAKGALLAAQWLIDKKGWFTLHDFFRSLYSSRHPF